MKSQNIRFTVTVNDEEIITTFRSAKFPLPHKGEFIRTDVFSVHESLLNVKTYIVTSVTYEYDRFMTELEGVSVIMEAIFPPEKTTEDARL